MFSKMMRTACRFIIAVLTPYADQSGKIDRVGRGGRDDDDYKTGPAQCAACGNAAWLDTWGYCVHCYGEPFPQMPGKDKVQ